MLLCLSDTMTRPSLVGQDIYLLGTDEIFSAIVPSLGPREGCIRLPRLADVLHCRAYRDKGLDYTERNDSSSGIADLCRVNDICAQY